jgi:hypothetical protein
LSKNLHFSTPSSKNLHAQGELLAEMEKNEGAQRWAWKTGLPNGILDKKIGFLAPGVGEIPGPRIFVDSSHGFA